VPRGDSTQTFIVWIYGETKELKIGSGLRVGEDGASFTHHFLPPKDASSFAFLAGEYTIDAYAKILDRNPPMLLSTVKVSLRYDFAAALCDHAKGLPFAWGPDSQTYQGDVSEPASTEGRSRSVSGSGRGMLP